MNKEEKNFLIKILEKLEERWSIPIEIGENWDSLDCELVLESREETAKEIFRDLEADCCVIKDKFYKKVKNKFLKKEEVENGK